MSGDRVEERAVWTDSVSFKTNHEAADCGIDRKEARASVRGARANRLGRCSTRLRNPNNTFPPTPHVLTKWHPRRARGPPHETSAPRVATSVPADACGTTREHAVVRAACHGAGAPARQPKPDSTGADGRRLRLGRRGGQRLAMRHGNPPSHPQRPVSREHA